ncbi:MAG: MauE/DoxX family redox-associated membrane protein [Desulfobacterales bacterium]|jgi:uncharacterized membrane protein YphA (DoxX/SURF4 family)|nr:MauE/DoxX family redox-associated membrane protein [Desulfobacterales bacterium]
MGDQTNPAPFTGSGGAEATSEGQTAAPGNAKTRFGRILPPALRLLIGAVFLYASYDKILHPGDFARAVHNYQILPAAAVNPVAVVLPWMELLLGFFLVAGIWLPGTTVLSALLLTVFNGALIFNLARGLDVSCGCFSTQITGAPATWGTAARDLVLLAASIYLTVSVFYPCRRKPTARNNV